MTIDGGAKLDAFSLSLAFRTASLTRFAPKCVFHYTTAAGFSGILHERAIRATNFSFLNDPTEVTYGRRVVESALAALARDAKVPTQQFLAEVSRHLTIETLAEVYVTSFTALPDDLSQWRAYGASLPEKYAIGFDAPTLIDLASALPNAMYAKVLYQQKDQDDRVVSVLRKALEFIEPEMPGPSDIPAYAVVTALNLVRLMPVLKDSSYEREEEWRVVMWHRNEETSPSFDTSRGVLRPYLRFPLGEHIPIVDVNVMAPARREAALKATALMLQANALEVVPHHSKIPFAE